MLKRRFPCLAMGMHYRLNKIQDITIACCILHNFIKEEKEMNSTNANPIAEQEREFQIHIGNQLQNAQQIQRQNVELRTQNFLINNYFTQ